MIHIFLEKPFKQTFISKMFIKSAYLSNKQQLATNTISIILLKLQKYILLVAKKQALSPRYLLAFILLPNIYHLIPQPY